MQRDSQPAGSARPQTALLLKITRSGSAGSNWVIALWMPNAGPRLEHAVRRRARWPTPRRTDRQPGTGQEAPGRSALDAWAVWNGLPEVRHLARSRQHSAAALAEQPGLERVEAHAAAPRRAGSLVEDDHPREPLAVLVRHEDLEPGVRLRAAREVAHQAEGRHAGAPEIPECTRVRAVLVAERAAVARVARRVPGGPGAPRALDRVLVVHPRGTDRGAVRGGRLSVVDRVGGAGGRRGHQQDYHDGWQESHGSCDTLASVRLRFLRCSMVTPIARP